jgi:hypothetical protein
MPLSSILCHQTISIQYKFEPEKSTLKRRVGLYVNKQVIFKRREDLEENNMHLIVIDIKTNVSVRFNPCTVPLDLQIERHQRNFFKNRLKLLNLTAHQELLLLVTLIWMLTCNLG